MNEPVPASDAPPPAQASFAKTLVYEDHATAPEILARIEKLREIDKEYEALSAAKFKWVLWTGIPGFACVFLAFCTAGITLPFALVLLIAWAVLLYQYYQLKRLDLEDHRYAIAQEFIRCVSRDMHPESRLRISIDFNHYHRAECLRGTEGGGWLNATTEKSYAMKWLEISGKLLDGHRFEVEVRQNVKRRERRKRKYTKVKEAMSEVVTLVLQVKPSRYPNLAAAPQMVAKYVQAIGPLKLAGVEGDRFTVSVLTPRQVRVTGRRANSNENAHLKLCDHHYLIKLMLATYQALNDCRGQPQRRVPV